MDLISLLRAIRTYRWLMIAGVVVAAAAAFFAGFSVSGSGVALRAQPIYNSTTNILVSRPGTSEFQAQIPAQTVQQGQTAPQARDLSSLTVIYAYMASGSAVQHLAEQQVGKLRTGEDITAAQRTTQPAGTEKNPGRYSLPVLQIVGTAETPERANAITAAASEAFLQYAKDKQAADKVADSDRVTFSELEQPRAVLSDTSSNPYIPLVATFAGVLFGFLALVLILFNVRTRRPQPAAAPEKQEAPAPVAPQQESPALAWSIAAEPQS